MYWKECPPFRSLLAMAVPFLRNLCPGAVSCRMRSDPTRKKREKYDSRRISIICELSRYSGRSRSGWSIFLLGVKSYPLPLSHMESRVFYHPMFKRLHIVYPIKAELLFFFQQLRFWLFQKIFRLMKQMLGPGQNDHSGPIQNDQFKSNKNSQRIS